MTRSSGASRAFIAVSFFMAGLMMTVSLLNATAEVRPRRGPDLQAQMLNNYRKYVDRYIRISGENWKYDEAAHTATHSFTLKNIAGVAYSEIILNVSYLNADGKSLQAQTLKIPGILGAYTSKKYTNLKVQKVPKDCDQVVLTISKAVIYP
jgi:hypothetical protein